MMHWNLKVSRTAAALAIAGLLFVFLPAAGCKENNGAAAPAATGARPTQVRAAPEPADGGIDLDALWPPVRTNPRGVLDFGEVLVNVPSDRTIELVNHGTVDVRLRDSRTNCGCTTADVAGLVVPAGGSLDLPIHFDAEGRLGERSATVDLFFEGWERPIKFRVVAMVVAN